MLHFVGDVLSYRRQQRNLLHPLVVHCISGVGHTGIFCLLAAALSDIQAGQGIFDVKAAAISMGKQRPRMLNDKHQLLFCYQALLYHYQDILIKRKY